MRNSQDTVGSMQLDEYVATIAEIYSANDRNRSVWDVWCHALHHAAAIAEQLRKKALADSVFDEIADFSLWLFTAVHKLAGRVGEPKERNEIPPETLIRIESGCSDLLWQRYPKVCPFCYLRRTKAAGSFEEGQELIGPCDYPLHDDGEPQKTDEKRAALEMLRHFSERMRTTKPKSIDEWQQMFGALFRTNLTRMSLVGVMLHLMEELGEVSDAMIRMYSYTAREFLKGEPHQRQLRLESQIADVFSWLFALVEAMNLNTRELFEREQWRLQPSAVGERPIRLSEIIWRRYGSTERHSFYCPFCKNAVCSCPLIFVPATRGMEELKALFNGENLPLGT